MTPVWPLKGGGSGGNLTCFLHYPHMVSYYLPMQFIALNAILKKIIGGFTWSLSFLAGTCEKITHKSVNFHGSLPKSNQLAFLIAWTCVYNYKPLRSVDFAERQWWAGVPPKKTIFWSSDLDKDRRSNLSIWKNFPTPKVYNCQIWLKSFQ